MMIQVHESLAVSAERQSCTLLFVFNWEAPRFIKCGGNTGMTDYA